MQQRDAVFHRRQRRQEGLQQRQQGGGAERVDSIGVHAHVVQLNRFFGFGRLGENDLNRFFGVVVENGEGAVPVRVDDDDDDEDAL